LALVNSRIGCIWISDFSPVDPTIDPLIKPRYGSLQMAFQEGNEITKEGGIWEAVI